MSISIYIAAPVVAWLVAQVLKYLLQAFKTKSLRDLSYLYTSGNMPSAHSALMIALLTVVGAREGVESALFGSLLVIAVIILYDAMNVRRAVGEQGVTLQKLLISSNKKDRPYLAYGHTLADVTVGSVLGFASAVIVLQFL